VFTFRASTTIPALKPARVPSVLVTPFVIVALEQTARSPDVTVGSARRFTTMRHQDQEAWCQKSGKAV
jgi:hypothetical protein